jgi:broad specificity phosphatase PhoE
MLARRFGGPVAELFLVRHAQASFHAEDYDCLSPLGERQSLWLGEHFAETGTRFDAVVTGTLRRHAQTAAGIAEGMGQPAGAALCHPGLDEYDFRALVGAFEAAEPTHPLVRARQAAPADKSAYYRVLRLALGAWADGRLGGPLPETWDGFRARVEAAASWLQELSVVHPRLLVISSGGAMATLLGGRFGLGIGHIVDLNLQIRNTSVSRFYLNRERFLLASWNGVPHLERPGRADSITYG